MDKNEKPKGGVVSLEKLPCLLGDTQPPEQIIVRGVRTDMTAEEIEEEVRKNVKRTMKATIYGDWSDCE